MKKSNNWIEYRSVFPPEFNRRPVPLLSEQDVLIFPESMADNIRSECSRASIDPYRSSGVEELISLSRDWFEKNSEHIFFKSLTERVKETPGYAFVQGLPVENLERPTPERGGGLPAGYKKDYISEFISCAIANTLGAEVFNFRQEGFGEAPLFDNVVPVSKLQNQKGAGGYKDNFPFHSESAWHRRSPDYLSLVGVRGAADAKTVVFSTDNLLEIGEIVDAIPPDDHFKVCAPQMYLQTKRDGMPLGSPEYLYQAPIIVTEKGIEIRLNLNGTYCATQEALHWLRRLESFIEDNCVAVLLTESTAVVMNNKKTCHTRSGYQPTFDGAQRWFLRTNLAATLWRNVGEKKKMADEVGAAAIEALIAEGWLDENYDLTDRFLPYFHTGKNNQALTTDQLELIEKAMLFTPMKDQRLV